MTADVLRVKQVLLNLLSNACKFTEDGDITLDVRQYEEEGTPWTVFAVRDTGIGIAPGDIPRLFTEFSQLRSLEGRNDGVGLGLAISQRLCVSMGGTITVASEVGKGTTFAVHLPTVAAAAPAGS
jgi:signal transduction histidine kinase